MLVLFVSEFVQCCVYYKCHHYPQYITLATFYFPKWCSIFTQYFEVLYICAKRFAKSICIVSFFVICGLAAFFLQVFFFRLLFVFYSIEEQLLIISKFIACDLK